MDKAKQPVEGGEGEVPAEPCKWCAKGNTPKVVDDDGTLVSITGRAGTLSHCYEEYWWPCLRFGIELHTTLSTSTVAQPTPSISDQAQRWEPIETAPKNRKLITGYLNPLQNWRTVLACYHTEGTLESDTDESGFAPEGWYEATEAYEYLMPCEQEPTHWMPLPSPPSSTGETK